MKKYGFLIIITILIILFGTIFFLNTNKPKPYSEEFFAMDTYITVKVYSNQKEKAQNALQQVKKLYQEYHNITNRYDTNSELYKINHAQGNDNITVSPKLYEIISYGSTWYEKSNHLLNINMGDVIDVWKKYRENQNGIPTQKELQEAGSTNFKNIQLLDNNQLKNTKFNIDLGAFVKGYVTELAGNYLKEQGLNHYLINAGGNVLVGDHPTDNYKIGIQNPDINGGLLTTLKASNVAVVTSGGYERKYIYDGIEYHHIIDPTTLFPPHYMKSVTVISPSSKEADALSTTLFLMTIEEGQEYIKKFPNTDVIWYSNDNQIIKTPGVTQYE